MDLTALDWILLLVLLYFAVSGYLRGFFLTLGSVVGFVLGAVAAFYLVPLAVELASGGWRVVVAIISLLVLIGLGQALGLAVARPFKMVSERSGLGVIERFLGAVLNTAACALMIVVVSFSAGQVGVPSITSTIARSHVVSTLEDLTPDVVRQGIAQARAAVLAQSGIPEISQQIFPAQEAPTQEIDNPALAQAAESVLKINGTAEACVQNQSGSGFAAAPEMVITNAHVLAGVDEPVVQTPSGQAYTGTVVYYDDQTDLAVIHAPGLQTPALSTGPEAQPGELVAFMGYPLGGPFSSKSATVQGLARTSTTSVDGTVSAPRQVYQLAADAQQGNSGGPLLDDQGQVIGVIFAKSETTQTGYALGMEELQPVLDQLDRLGAAVPTGQCVAG